MNIFRKFFIVLVILFLIRFDSYFVAPPMTTSPVSVFPVNANVDIIDIYYLDYLIFLDDLLASWGGVQSNNPPYSYVSFIDFYGSLDRFSEIVFGNVILQADVVYRRHFLHYVLFSVFDHPSFNMIHVNAYYNSHPSFFDYYVRSFTWAGRNYNDFFFFNFIGRLHEFMFFRYSPNDFAFHNNTGFRPMEGMVFTDDGPGYTGQIKANDFFNDPYHSFVIYRIHYDPVPICYPPPVPDEDCPNIFDFANNLTINRSFINTIINATSEIINQYDYNVDVSNVSP